MKNIKKSLIVVLALVSLGLVWFLAYPRKVVAPTTANRKACTEEAKICPDGSAVSRTGPNCEFVPCPSENNGNWKTYKNNKYGFSLNYPENWKIWSSGESIRSFNASNETVPVFFGLEILGGPVESVGENTFSITNVPKITVYVYNNPKDLTTLECYRRIINDDVFFNKLSFSVVKQNNVEILVDKNRSVFILSNGRYFYDVNSDADIFNEVIASFKVF